jgi:two-component system chemotaxis sensor kinase CheA
MAQDPYKYFRPEARDLVDQFAKGVLDLEKGESTTTAVQKLLRLAHTLKGAARIVKQSEIADLAHAIEDRLAPFRDGEVRIKREQIDGVLAHLDGISDRIATLTMEQPAPGKSEPDRGARTVRADIAETDAVLDGVAQAHALLNGLRNAAQGIEQARRLSDALMTQASASMSPMRPGGAHPRAAIGNELRRRFGVIEREVDSGIDQMDRELRQLREAAERLRLVAADSLFTSLERIARDTARAQGKQVHFTSRGGDIRLDLHVLETVQIQVVRNAVAHGIEPESERAASAKPPAGQVSVEITRRGRKIAFVTRDDGRGVDLAAMRRLAEQRGLAGADDPVRMLLRGGISTARRITDVSGRGIGLDIVRESVERLGGTVKFDTVPGQGTTFELLIPPTLASMEVLTVEAGGHTLSIPLAAVRGTMRFAVEEISHSASSATVAYEKTAIPFRPLASALAGAPWPSERNWTAIVIASASGTAALGVDRLLGAGPIVVRALPDAMTVSPVIAGTSLDAEGNPQLVIDPDGLVAAAARGASDSRDAATPKRPLLVVDDSMTTRMLEKSILESAGYDVDVALSGEEALDRLRTKRFALILVDVEMPGMDGFTFIEHLRADTALRDIPAILVTSRASPDDLKRGRDAGANGHIVKSEFDQAELLGMIERMIG